MSKKITGSKEVRQGGKGEKGGKMLKKESDHKKGRMGELQSKQASTAISLAAQPESVRYCQQRINSQHLSDKEAVFRMF